MNHEIYLQENTDQETQDSPSHAHRPLQFSVQCNAPGKILPRITGVLFLQKPCSKDRFSASKESGLPLPSCIKCQVAGLSLALHTRMSQSTGHQDSKHCFNTVSTPLLKESSIIKLGFFQNCFLSSEKKERKRMVPTCSIKGYRNDDAQISLRKHTRYSKAHGTTVVRTLPHCQRFRLRLWQNVH